MSDENNSGTSEKECKLIEHIIESKDSCLEEQSSQMEIGEERTDEYIVWNKNYYDEDSDKSSSDSNSLVPTYSTGRLFEKNDRSNSNYSIQSYKSKIKSSEECIQAINLNHTSRSSTSSVAQNIWIRPEDEKSIKSINENYEVKFIVKRKIDKKLHKRRLNARIHRLVPPKSALVVFSELFQGIPIHIELSPYFNDVTYTATIEIDGQKYTATNNSKTEAKQNACENLFRSMLAKKLIMQSEEKKESSMKIGMKVEEHGSVSGPVIPSQDDFPWPHFASLALHKLINLWKLQPLLTNINLNDERSTSITLQPKIAAPMKRFPEDPSKYNPVQLLNQMKPGTEFVDTLCSKSPPCFHVQCVIEGIPFIGQHSSKKTAKNKACIAAIKHFWNYDFHKTN